MIYILVLVWQCLLFPRWLCINDPWHIHSSSMYLLWDYSINLGMSVSHQNTDKCRRALVSSANSTAAARYTLRRLDRITAVFALANRSSRAKLYLCLGKVSCGWMIWQPGWSSLMPALFLRNCLLVVPWTRQCAADMTGAGLLCCLVLATLASIYIPHRTILFAYLSLPLAAHQVGSMVESYFLFIWIAYIYLFVARRKK